MRKRARYALSLFRAKILNRSSVCPFILCFLLISCNIAQHRMEQPPNKSGAIDVNVDEAKVGRGHGAAIIDYPPLVLTIINVDQAISSNTSESIECVCNKLLDGCPCTTPDSIDTTSECKQTRDKIYQSIMRFRKDSDRWIALASVLLKSMAFHRSAQAPLAFNTDESNFSSVNELKMQSIVDLPRTKFNRPFIPHLTVQRTHDTISETKIDAEGDNEDPTAKSVCPINTLTLRLYKPHRLTRLD